MPEIETTLQRSRLFAVRVPDDLYRALERDAAQLGVSLSDVGRMRLRTGRVPTLHGSSGDRSDRRGAACARC
jgi:hypothetical protein